MVLFSSVSVSKPVLVRETISFTGTVRFVTSKTTDMIVTECL